MSKAGPLKVDWTLSKSSAVVYASPVKRTVKKKFVKIEVQILKIITFQFTYSICGTGKNNASSWFLVRRPRLNIFLWETQGRNYFILGNQMKFSSESWLFWIFNEANISANLWERSSSLWQARISLGIQFGVAVLMQSSLCLLSYLIWF